MDHAARLAENPSPASGPLPASALEAGVEIGDFRIERRLGAGGMGVVYQARQLSLNRLVALKVLGQALTRSTDVSRFQREAQAAARLKHPAIAQVYFIGQDRHLCYLAMELIDGASLRRVLDRLGMTATADSSLDSAVREDLGADPQAEPVRFDVPTEATAEPTGRRQGGKHVAGMQPSDKPPADPQLTEVNPYLSPQARELRIGSGYIRRVCEVIRDAAHALAHAHEQGVVHRDIKPDNLLLDRKGKVHLIDFGVARFFDDQAVTYTGQLVGTPLYMSPEQVTGRGAIDARTDIYSLGLVLYELLTLRPPIEATNRENLLRTIVTKPLPPIAWKNASVKSDLARVVHMATQKDPDLRYRSAADLAADLDRFLAGQAVTAPAYHFRLDEREITAARPGVVVLAAVNFFLVSVFLFLAFASFSLMFGAILLGMKGGGGGAIAVGGMQLAIAVVILGVGITVGQGILAARIWARWAGVGLAAIFTIGSVAAIIALCVTIAALLSGTFEGMEPPPTAPEGADDATMPFNPKSFMIGAMLLYALPLATGVILGGTALWALLSRQSAAWFRLAREIRAEHRLARDRIAA